MTNLSEQEAPTSHFGSTVQNLCDVQLSKPFDHRVTPKEQWCWNTKVSQTGSCVSSENFVTFLWKRTDVVMSCLATGVKWRREHSKIYPVGIDLLCSEKSQTAGDELASKCFCWDGLWLLLKPHKTRQKERTWRHRRGLQYFTDTDQAIGKLIDRPIVQM